MIARLVADIWLVASMLIVTEPGSCPNVLVAVDQRAPLLMLMVETPAFGLAAPPPPEITATPPTETVPALMLMSVTLEAVAELKKPAVPVPTTAVNTPPPFVTDSP